MNTDVLDVFYNLHRNKYTSVFQLEGDVNVDIQIGKMKKTFSMFEASYCFLVGHISYTIVQNTHRNSHAFFFSIILIPDLLLSS
jgi:hypothetical protein